MIMYSLLWNSLFVSYKQVFKKSYDLVLVRYKIISGEGFFYLDEGQDPSHFSVGSAVSILQDPWQA
jgi:hypothetical protein